MFLTRILRRKDTVAIIVVIVLGLALTQFVFSLSSNLSLLLLELINQAPQPGARTFEWRSGVFDPAILLLLQVVVLELFLQVIIRVRRLFQLAVTQAKTK